MSQGDAEMRCVFLRAVREWRTVLTVVLFMSISLALAGRAHSQAPPTTLEIKGPRPVLQAVMDLESKYGYAITYEDPRYVYDGDLQDVTKQRRDLYRWPSGKAPKTVVPLGGKLTVTLPASASIDESTMYELLQQIAEAWFDSDKGGGHFRVEREAGVFHVVPTETRDADGTWQGTESLLAGPISLASEPRTEREVIKAIGDAISVAAGVRVVAVLNSGFVFGPPERAQYILSAEAEPASNVLMRAIQMIKKNLSWYLWYDPMAHDYLLNVYDVSESTLNSTSKGQTPNTIAPASSSSAASCGPTASTCSGN